MIIIIGSTACILLCFEESIEEKEEELQGKLMKLTEVRQRRTKKILKQVKRILCKAMEHHGFLIGISNLTKTAQLTGERSQMSSKLQFVGHCLLCFLLNIST